MKIKRMFSCEEKNNAFPAVHLLQLGKLFAMIGERLL